MKKINIKSSKNNFDYNVIDSFLRKIKSEPLNNDAFIEFSFVKY